MMSVYHSAVGNSADLVCDVGFELSCMEPESNHSRYRVQRNIAMFVLACYI